MRKRNKIILALVLASIAAAVLYGQRGPLAMKLMARLASERMSAQPLAALPDGLHVGLCGSGSPLPDERRSPPCTLVIAGQRVFLFDAGGGAARGINRMGFNPGDIEAIFLTHFHSDHIDGLGEVMLQRWVGGSRTEPVPVHGPQGTARIVAGLTEVYAQDKQYRIAHHGEQVVPPSGFGGAAREFPLAADAFASTPVIDEADLKVTAFRVGHSPVHPAVGYRVNYKDRSVVISGDTIKTVAVAREAKGADLLVHEALAPHLVAILEQSARAAGRDKLAKIFKDIPDYHTPPQQVAEIARDAGVGAVLLTHIVPALPPLPGFESAFLGDARQHYGGPFRLGRDGDFVSLPAGGKQIQFSTR